MPQVINELYEKYPRAVYGASEEQQLKRSITMNEMSFVRTLTEEQKEEFFELTSKYQKLHKILEKNSFAHGFYISYRLLQEMRIGANDTYRQLDSLFLD